MTDKIDLIVQQYPDVWKTRASFFSWLKGVIRKGWNNSPQKVKLINKLRRQIPNPNPRGKKPTVWGVTCEICLNDYALKDCQVDHRSEETAQLTQVEHIQSCAEKLLLVVEDDLRIICKPCHNLHSIAQSKGVTFEQAKIEKQVIEFSKLKAAQQIKVLQEYDSCGKMAATNAKARVELYRRIIEGGK